MKLIKIISEIRQLPSARIKAKVMDAEFNIIRVYFKYEGENMHIFANAYPDIKEVQMERAPYRETNHEIQDFIEYLKEKNIPYRENNTEFMNNILIIDLMYFQIDGIEKLK
jgi:hypothetical protein